MPFTRATAAAMGRQGGRSTFARHGREHMQAIGRKGFDGLARSLGFAGGSRKGALVQLQSRGRLRNLGPDPGPAIAWAERVLEAFDPDVPEVPC
jgi:general stress protein YciG